MARKRGGDDNELLRVACFILLDAMIFHEAVSARHPAIRSLRVLAGSKGHGSLHRELEAEWGEILKIDYGPIFQLSRDLLNALPTSPTSDHILHQLADAALSAVGSGILLKHDFMGRIYHRLLLRTSGHFYATYYTSIPAARLLAQLTLKTPHPSWGFKSKSGEWALDDISRLDNFTILDPACGSGTLLSAAYVTLKDIYILSRPTAPMLSEFHKVCVEDVIRGWDVLDFAAHLTLTTLALHEQAAQFERSGIIRVDSGVGKDGTVHLGSLDILKSQRGMLGRGFMSTAEGKGLAGDREVVIPDDPVDVVLMNPPFSRSAKPNLKFGYKAADVRRKMSKELRAVAAEHDLTGVGHAGLAPYFVAMGVKLLKPGGRLGVVIPRSCLSGVSWTIIRDLLLDKCQMEYVVSNYDTGDSAGGVEAWNWSEQTDLGEVLLIARRLESKAEAKKREPVRFLNFWFKPQNDVESLLSAQQVLRVRESASADLSKGEWEPVVVDGIEAGTLFTVPHEGLRVNFLYPCVFANPALNALAYQLVANPPYKAKRFEDVARRVGPDIAQVKKEFKKSTSNTAHPIVWGHQGAMNSMQLDRSFVGYGNAKRGAKSGAFHSKGAARLLIAERPHLHTESLLATLCPEKALATAFWEVRPNDKKYVPLLLLWLQSTFGFITFLSFATSSMGDIFKMKKGQLKTMWVPDPASVDLDSAEELLDRLGSEPFEVNPHEFARAAGGSGPRWEIDQFFAKALGLKTDLAPLYPLLAGDPVVCSDRFVCRIQSPQD